MPIIEGAYSAPVLNAGAPVNGTDEVQTLTYGGVDAVATAGTFRVCYEGFRTAALAFDVSAANMQTALRALPSIGALGCSVGVAAGPPRVYTVTFDGGNMAKLNVALLTVEDNTMLAAGLTAVTVTVAVGTPGVTATGRGAPKGALLLDTTNGVFYVNTGTPLLPVWAPAAVTTATTAELNKLAGVTAGTALASKAAVLGANKNLDMLAVADGGLALGAGAGTAITATAAELNLLDTSVAGTAVASKALALGANKNVDTLAIADGGLKLGAGAGTAVAATAAELNKAADADALAADGLLRMGLARFTFDPSGDAAMRTIAAHGTGVTLPIHAVVIGGFVDVNTAFTSNGGNTGTVAISVQGADDIIVAAVVGGAPYSTIGRKAIVPKSNTPESTSVKCTQAREITCTVAVEALTAGKLTGFLHYVVSVASA